MSKNFVVNRAKIRGNKTLITVALVLMLTLTALMAGMQSAKAAVLQIDTFCYVMVSPNPVGVGQNVLVAYQLDKVSPTASGVTGGEHFKGFTVSITKPEGTVETKGPFEASAISGDVFTYTPDKAGNYTFQSSFPGQWINTTSYQYWFKPSTSKKVEVTVQQEPIPGLPAVPLPTDYWTRPIYGENKGWSQIADNWPMRKYDRPSRFFSGDSAFAPYTSAPNSAHILWTKPIIFGGIGGGPFGDKVYYMGLSYEQFYNPLIINGRIIYSEHGPTSYGDTAGGSIDPFGDLAYGTRCLDLYTGEEIWFMNNTNIMFAQLYDIENPNEHGLIAHLWEVIGPDLAGMSTWKMYDAFTGRYVLTITNVPIASWQTNAVVFGPNGELLSYTLDPIGNRLVLWNSTLALGGYPSNIYYPERYNLITGAVVNGRRGIQWNVSIPDIPGEQTIRIMDHEDGYMLAAWESVANWSAYTTFPGVIVEAAYDTKTGQQLWVQNRTNIQGRIFYSKNIGNGVYTRFESPTMKIYGYSIKTGEQLWETNPISKSDWAYFTYMHHIAYGKLFTLGYDGYIRAWNVTTGKLIWENYFGSAGYETPYGTWPSYTGFNIADGKIYLTNDDHSPDSVPWRGGKLWVYDAEKGDLLWSISGWIRHGAISDGILTAINSLDGQVYTFGKGPSATTVTAPDTEITLGQSVVIKGTVTDQSAGAKKLVQDGKFSVVPAMSDESMGPWMEYLYMQKPVPTNATGVTVTLDVLDANGNYRSIGTATTDMSGTFGFVWKPDIPGKYTLIATFMGSESYYASYAQTYAVAVEAPAATPTPTPLALPPTETYFAVSTIAIIIAIAIAVVLILRKK